MLLSTDIIRNIVIPAVGCLVEDGVCGENRCVDVSNILRKVGCIFTLVFAIQLFMLGVSGLWYLDGVPGKEKEVAVPGFGLSDNLGSLLQL